MVSRKLSCCLLLSINSIEWEAKFCSISQTVKKECIEQMVLITCHLSPITTSSSSNSAQCMLFVHSTCTVILYFRNCDAYTTLLNFELLCERMWNSLPISLLHVPSIIFSSIRNICRPGKSFAHPLPVKSRNMDAWLYGLYSYACVPLPALNPIYVRML